MNHTPHIYPPVNRCIYCGGDTEPLTDEHIIPLGLNGDRILPQASCKRCAGMTSRIERTFLREEALPMRTALKFKTRRPKERPLTFPLGIVQNGAEKIINVAPPDHLILLPLPIYEMPIYLEEILLGKSRSDEGGIKPTSVQVLSFCDPELIRAKYQAESVFTVLRFDPYNFALMLAKIAYCIAVAYYGYEEIAECFILPHLRGERNDIARYVGSSSQVLDPESGLQHTAMVQSYADPTGQGRDFILVGIKLFADVPSPGYMVVVGRRVTDAAST